LHLVAVHCAYDWSVAFASNMVHIAPYCADK
jgi:hypothetical protein